MEREAFVAGSDLRSLYERFGARIRNYLRRRTQDAALAEDLTQETFLRAAEHLHSFRGEGEISTWFYRIAANLFRDYLRNRRCKQQGGWADGEVKDVSRIPAADPSAPHILERQAVAQCVRDCIDALPGHYGTALLLHAVEDKTVEDGAALLRCNKETFKVRLYRARRLFKTLAAERCEVSVERDGEICCLPKEPNNGLLRHNNRG